MKYQIRANAFRAAVLFSLVVTVTNSGAETVYSDPYMLVLSLIGSDIYYCPYCVMDPHGENTFNKNPLIENWGEKALIPYLESSCRISKISDTIAAAMNIAACE